MQAIKTIGLDIAKSVFQVHGVDAEGNVIIRRRLKRRYVLAFFQKVPPCLRTLAIRTAWLRAETNVSRKPAANAITTATFSSEMGFRKRQRSTPYFRRKDKSDVASLG